MLSIFRFIASATITLSPLAHSAEPEGRAKAKPPPGQLETSALVAFETLDPSRRNLVETALKAARDYPLNQYLFGSADPARGGFDCSGAVHFILKQVGYQPPRSSAAQFEWIKKTGKLTEVPAETSSLEAEVFTKLEPGDLLFWSGTYQPTDGRTNKITHVQLYLGKEKAGDRHVMIGSSDGRSYRRISRCGFGVFDFKLPRKGSKSRFVGFGPPPAP